MLNPNQFQDPLDEVHAFGTDFAADSNRSFAALKKTAAEREPAPMPEDWSPRGTHFGQGVPS